MRAAIVGGGVIGAACAFALLDVADEIVLLDAGAVGGGASAGNAGWITPSLAMPLASPGIVRTGLRSAFDPRGALVIRPTLDPTWPPCERASRSRTAGSTTSNTNLRPR